MINSLIIDYLNSNLKMKFSNFVTSQTSSNLHHFQQNLTPKRSSPAHSNFDGQNTVKSSARVLQLKKEIEDLDARLLSTNTLNFEKLRTSSLRNDTANVMRSHYESSDHSECKGYQFTSNSQKIDMRGSVQIYQQIQDNASQIGLI